MRKNPTPLESHDSLLLHSVFHFLSGNSINSTLFQTVEICEWNGIFLNINIKLKRGQTHVRVTCKIPMTHRHPKYCVPISASGLWIKAVCWFLLFPVIFLRGNKCVIKEFLSFGKCCYYFYFWHMTLSVFMHFCLSSIWCNKPLLLKVSNIWLFANFKQLPNFWHRISIFLMTIKENQLNSTTHNICLYTDWMQRQKQ